MVTKDDEAVRAALVEHIIGLPIQEKDILSWVEFTSHCKEEDRFFLCYFEWHIVRGAAVLRMTPNSKPAVHWHLLTDWYDEHQSDGCCPERYIGGCPSALFFALLEQHTPEHAIGRPTEVAALSA